MKTIIITKNNEKLKKMDKTTILKRYYSQNQAKEKFSHLIQNMGKEQLHLAKM